ncbi:hypothetical protein [Tolypothrix sp. VBCCA 56010]|uniref:hypothetical protein n=1 Tax=Tolypothrix sp. VBCCA 56010 TaxID=3137731 RepID=UPI003D7DA818
MKETIKDAVSFHRRVLAYFLFVLQLSIGYDRANYSGVTREWLYWYDEFRKRYPTPQQRIQRLAEKLRRREAVRQCVGEAVRSSPKGRG